MEEHNLHTMQPRSQTVFAVTVAMFACATLFIFFRMLSRIWIVRKVSLDDYFILLAWVWSTLRKTGRVYRLTVYRYLLLVYRSPCVTAPLLGWGDMKWIYQMTGSLLSASRSMLLAYSTYARLLSAQAVARLTNETITATCVNGRKDVHSDLLPYPVPDTQNL